MKNEQVSRTKALDQTISKNSRSEILIIMHISLLKEMHIFPMDKDESSQNKNQLIQVLKHSQYSESIWKHQNDSVVNKIDFYCNVYQKCYYKELQEFQSVKTIIKCNKENFAKHELIQEPIKKVLLQTFDRILNTPLQCAAAISKWDKPYKV